MTKQGLRHLAATVKARRTELGLAQGDLSGRGGPSVVVVGQIERMQQANPQALTLARLDRALDWEAGSAAGALAGRDPKPIGSVRTQEHLTPSGGGRVEQPSLRVVEDEQNPVIDAINKDPFLLPESKAHFLNQYELLRRVQPTERLAYVAHDREDEVDPAEEERIEAEVRAEVAKRHRPKGPK